MGISGISRNSDQQSCEVIKSSRDVVKLTVLYKREFQMFNIVIMLLNVVHDVFLSCFYSGSVEYPIICCNGDASTLPLSLPVSPSTPHPTSLSIHPGDLHVEFEIKQVWLIGQFL